MDLTGRHLGKYELLERVGQGGMAYVYRAYQPTIDRHVAVKVLHSHLAEDKTFLERFKREAKGLGSLRHPHIVSVIDFDVDDGWYYMVMDFIEGQTLQAMLEERGQLAVDEALHLTSQLAGALDYAHRHGRIHRDIKPGNIMFAGEGHQHPVLTDFGLTRLLDNATITISGTIAGTPAYMSPESAQGEKVDARADIYSLGVVLYEMVTGRRPYYGETPLSVIMKLVLEPLPPALSINPDLPPTVDAIIQKATAKAPEERYQTAGEFREALEAERQRLEIEGQRLHTGDWGLDGERTQLLSPLPVAGPADSLSRESASADEHENAQPLPASGEPPLRAAMSPPPRGLRWLPLLSIAALLVVALVVGFIVFDGVGGETAENTPVPTTELAAALETPAPIDTAAPETETPQGEATQASVASPQATQPPAPQPAGSLRFAAADGSNLRSFTLSLENVPLPPGGFHYELWFDVAGRAAPENVAALAVQDGRISYTDAVDDNLAASVSAARVSLEPDFDDDPSIAPDIAFGGAVEAQSGLAEIILFATGSVD